MSWDSYIDNIVEQSKGPDGQHNIDKVTLCGKNGAAWTSAGKSNSLQLRPEEMVNIGKALTCKKFEEFQAHGLMVEGVKYNFLREEEGVRIMAKKKGAGAITVEGTNQAFIVAHCPEGFQQGICNTAVNKVAQYLRDQNY